MADNIVLKGDEPTKKKMGRPRKYFDLESKERANKAAMTRYYDKKRKMTDELNKFKSMKKDESLKRKITDEEDEKYLIEKFALFLKTIKN